jgi:predicted deacylase
MDTNACFAATYAAAREKFLAAALDAGADLRTIPHPLTGPEGEALGTDVAILGPPDAPRRLVLVSATHGVEGHCGSGAQVALLRGGDLAHLPEGVAVVIVHAINPYGFAWSRRVTEDNVDLNRNFVDFARALPENPAYDALKDSINPPTLDADIVKRSDEALRNYAISHGSMAMQSAVSAGQYRHADGVWYGGQAPTWSRRTIEAIAARELSGAEAVAVVDFHTGLGPFAYGEIITEIDPLSPLYAKAKAWYGDGVTSTLEGTSTSARLTGTMDAGLARALGNVPLLFVALEFGTRDVQTVLKAVREDNWLHLYGQLDSDQGRAIKARIRDAFYPDDDAWRAAIVARAREVVGKALRGLAGEAQSAA